MSETPQSPCSAGQAAQLDFWVGDWDLTWEGGQGSNSVTKAYGGCVLIEKFDGQPGMALQGMSVSSYDPHRDIWQQTWVDDQGSYLALSGGLTGKRFVLSCENMREGQTVQLRMVFRNIAANSLDWDWQRFEPENGTWKNVWQIHYQRKVP